MSPKDDEPIPGTRDALAALSIWGEPKAFPHYPEGGPMNKEQQAKVLMEAINAHGASYAVEVLSNVLTFIFDRSRDGYVDFSIEDLVETVLGE